MVASDRVSAFDVIMAETIADKGRVLTAMTSFWCEEMSDVVPGTQLAIDPDEIRAALGGDGRAGGVGGTGGPGAARRHAPARVHRARVPGRAGLRGVRAVAYGARHPHASRAPHGQPAGRAHVHALDEGGAGPRSQHRLRGRRRSGGSRRRVGGAGRLPGALHPGRRPHRGRRVRPGRHEVRARLGRRGALSVRRGLHAGLVAPVAGGPGGARHDAAGVRQAAAARLARGAAVGPPAAAPSAAPRGEVGHVGALHRRLRARHGARMRDWYGATT